MWLLSGSSKCKPALAFGVAGGHSAPSETRSPRPWDDGDTGGGSQKPRSGVSSLVPSSALCQQGQGHARRGFAIPCSPVAESSLCWKRLVGAPGINEAAWCWAAIDASCINCAVFQLCLLILSYVVTARDVSLRQQPSVLGVLLSVPALPRSRWHGVAEGSAF